MKRLIIFTFIALFALPLMAQKRYDEIEYPDLNPINTPEVEEFNLDNGIKFLLVEDKELPLINIQVTVKTGSILEPASKTGLASMTGTVIREGGSENYPADRLNELLENNAASLSTFIGFGSGGANLSILKEDLDELLPVFVDVLQNPRFPEDKIELAKTQTKSGISRRNDNQQQIAGREFQKLIYGENSVYTRQTEYETVDNITRQDMIDFHEDAFVGANMTVGIIGDFNTEEMKQKLREAFGSLPEGSPTNLLYPEVDYNYPTTINFIDKPDVNQSYVTMGHIGGLRENPDYPAIQVMNQVLGGGFSSRLFQEVRTNLGLAYSVGGGYGSNINYPGTFRLTTMTSSATTAEAIDAIIKEVKKLQNEPITQEELDNTKDQFLNSLVFRYDSKSKILNERISNEYNGLSPDAFDELIEGIRNTTVEDVQRVAQEYLKPDQIQILVVGNASEIGDQLEKYGNVNEIDISIPRPSSGEEQAEAGDTVQGKEWLEKMANAVLEPGKEVESITTVGEQTLNTPMGEVAVSGNITINFDENTQEAVLNTPQGQVEISVTENSGTQRVAGQEFPMQPAQVQQIQQEMRRNYLNIALNRDALDVEFLGKETMDGQELVKLKINLESPITYYLDPATSLPAMSTYSQFNPQTGSNQTVRTEYSDWNTVDGVTYAFATISYAGEQKASENNIESLEVNQ